MSESLEIRAGRLLAQYRIFNGQMQADLGQIQRNRKTIEITAPAPAETTDEKMFRIHNSKRRAPGPADQSVVTRIRVNGKTVSDFTPIFVESGGQAFNLKNSVDRGIFIETFWPDFPQEGWPGIFNKLLTQGTISSSRAPDFVRQLKQAY